MSDIILHHYPFSTFSEKVRAVLGYKGLAYQSVEIAGLPPRPLLSPLTGGYRRAPVLQVGADIYCDTNVILPALDRLHPEKTLYPKGSEASRRAWASPGSARCGSRPSACWCTTSASTSRPSS